MHLCVQARVALCAGEDASLVKLDRDATRDESGAKLVRRNVTVVKSSDEGGHVFLPCPQKDRFTHHYVWDEPSEGASPVVNAHWMFDSEKPEVHSVCLSCAGGYLAPHGFLDKIFLCCVCVCVCVLIFGCHFVWIGPGRGVRGGGGRGDCLAFLSAWTCLVDVLFTFLLF